ncbi:hypothetical protein Poly30_06280 [Planctomycetes bacterium Poly30]|uniref:Mg(2+) transport ATPase n=1 Tax=Saltatorellus ferox TaxID=2528018 RepID=A0A518EM15_9BACT|nr:hypothetical protein Poly30_06280 [Planctomycetes bacterium Poly30]
MPQLQETAGALPSVVYGAPEILVNLGVSIVLGMIVAIIYRQTHKGLSYSQSFTLTVIFVAVIVAIVMMVIGNSLSRAFALVGALSIIRFRTVVKDTKDTAFVFWALSVGMAAGTGNYVLGGIGTAVVSVLALVLHATNFGALYKSEFILRFRYATGADSSAHLEQINLLSKRSSMLHIEHSGDGKSLQLTYDIVLKEGRTAQELATAMGALPSVSEVVLIASKSDVDY